jgi:hypothetical protein
MQRVSSVPVLSHWRGCRQAGAAPGALRGADEAKIWIDGREPMTRTGRERANIWKGVGLDGCEGELIRLMDRVPREQVRDRALPRRLVFLIPFKRRSACIDWELAQADLRRTIPLGPARFRDPSLIVVACHEVGSSMARSFRVRSDLRQLLHLCVPRRRAALGVGR